MNQDNEHETDDSWICHLHQAIRGATDVDRSPSDTAPDEFVAVRECLALLEQARRESSHSAAEELTRSWNREAVVAQHRMGRFEIIRELGRGGQGIVFLAHDPALARQVAVKVPRPEALTSAPMRERFVREAQAAALLSHPAIVTVHEVGQAMPNPYLVIDFCSGGSLQDILAAREIPLGIRATARFVAEIAGGLHYAHQHNVLHRDVKPSNVLLAPRVDATTVDATDDILRRFMPKLTDFGLARVGDQETSLTKSGAILGTPAYMAPEQAQGIRAAIGPATDVYGLGLLLYEMLVGDPPFSAISDADMLRQVLFEEPPAPRMQRPEIPADLEAICLCALDKNPAARYSSAAALREDLHRFLDGRPTKVRPLSALRRLQKWTRRNRALAALLAVIVVGAAALLAGQSWANVRIAASLATAEDRAQELRRYTYDVDMRLAQEAWDNGVPHEARGLIDKYLPQADLEDLRGMEWHYLNDCFRRDGQVFIQHPTPVTSLVATMGSRCIATGDPDGVVRIWDSVSGKLRHTLPTIGEGAPTIVFTPDDQQLITGGNDRVIHFWSATGEKLRELRGHDAPIRSIAVSCDKRYLVSGDADGVVLLWDLNSYTRVKEICRYDSPISWVACHPVHPDFVVIGRDDGQGDRREIPSGDVVVALKHTHKNPGWRGAELWQDWIWAVSDKEVACWQIAHTRPEVAGNLIETLQADCPLVTTAYHWPTFAIGRSDGVIDVRSVRGKWGPQRLLRGHQGPVSSFGVPLDANTLLSGSADKTVRRWRLGGGYGTAADFSVGRYAYSLNWSPAGDRLVFALQADDLKSIVRRDNHWELENSVESKNSVAALSTSDDGAVISLTDEGIVREWSADGQLLHTVQLPIQEQIVAYDRSGRRFVVAENKQSKLTVFGYPDGNVCWQAPQTANIKQVECHATGFTVSLDFAGAIRVFDLESGKVLGQSPAGPVATQFGLSKQGDRIATINKDRTIRVYDLPSFQEHAQFVRSASSSHLLFVDDDRRLLSIDEVNIELLNPDSGHLLLRLPNPLATPFYVAANPRGDAVALSRGERVIILPLRIR